MKLLRPILFFLAVLLSITPTFVHPSFVSKHSSGTSSGLRRSQLAASSAINHLSNTSRLLRLEALRRNDMGFCTDAPVETSIKLINNEKTMDKDSPQCAGIYARSVESVWSASNSDYVVLVPIENPTNGLYKKDMKGVVHLDNWFKCYI